jgi:hypothetical protein
MKRKFEETLRNDIKSILTNAGYRSDAESDTDSEDDVKEYFSSFEFFFL